MKIDSIVIDNILGTRHAEFPPGTVTVISGGNGTGKTSIVDALAFIFEGGHDAGMLRRGARKGQVTIHLDSGVTISKTVTESGSKVEITDANGLVIASPQKFIQSLGESLAVNPAKLLRIDSSTAAGRKALAASLLEIMPLSFTVDDMEAEIASALPGVVAMARAVFPSAPLSLDGLNRLRKQIEETRRRVGVDARDAEGAVNKLCKSLPAEDIGDAVLARADNLASEMMASGQRESAELEGIRGDAQVAIEAAKDDFSKRERELREELDRKLHDLTVERTKYLEAITKAEREASDEIRKKYAPEHARLNSEWAAAKEQAAAYERAKGARETIEQMRQRCKEKSLEYERWTQVIEAIDGIKKRKLDDLPVPGVVVEGDRVLIDGVAWEHVNTARRVGVAMQICAARAGTLPFMIIDDAEHLDSETWEELKQAAVDGGFQVIAARVSDGPLSIEMVAA